MKFIFYVSSIQDGIFGLIWIIVFPLDGAIQPTEQHQGNAVQTHSSLAGIRFADQQRTKMADDEKNHHSDFSFFNS